MASDLLKIPKLKGSENYEVWSIQIHAVLVEKGYYVALEQPRISSLNLSQIAKALSLLRLSLAPRPLL
jgi:hypothetical protein